MTTLDARRLQQRRPWVPDALADLPDVDGLSYVAVDEIVGEVVALSVCAWPASDGHGRLRFDDTSRGHALVSWHELRDTLYRGRLRRNPRVGDVFAAKVPDAILNRLQTGEDVVLDESLELREVMPGDVYDVSADARRVAKLAFYSAAAPPTSWTDAEQRRQQGKADHLRARARATTVRPRTRATVVLPTLAPDEGDVPKPWRIPSELVLDREAGGFVQALQDEPDSLVYFLLNEGDGDSQVLLLPADARTPYRRVMIVDIATTRKVTPLLEALHDHELLPDLDTPALFPVVVATHPHEDHIGGLPNFLSKFAGNGQIGDFWEPGYYHPSDAFVETMALLEELGIDRTQPTSGMTRWVGSAKVTVLAPGVGLRVRYDSYGVDVNDASIALKVEFPAVRVAEHLEEMADERRREYLRLDSPWALILGADAQTMSWGQVEVDWPELHRQHDTALYGELAAARGRDYLAAQVLKVSHHASKHGINLELVERIKPKVALISSVGGGGRYNFPHALATEAIREALQPSTSGRSERRKDHDLGIHYTGATTKDGDGPEQPLGSIAIVVPPTRGSKLTMWRFRDPTGERIDLPQGVPMKRLYAAS